MIREVFKKYESEGICGHVNEKVDESIINTIIIIMEDNKKTK